MAKQRNGEQGNGEQGEQVEERRATDLVPTANHDIVFRRDHPQDRCSFGIAGVPGIVVFPKGFFVGEVPTTITLSCALQAPRLDAKASKAEAAAAKAQAKADKEAEKVAKAAAKAEEKKAKADEALAKARAKADEAVAKLAAKINPSVAEGEAAQ